MDDVARVLQGSIDAREQIQQQAASLLAQQRQRDELAQTLGLTLEQQSFFAAYRQALSLKSLRRYIQMYALYRMEPVLEGVARRLSVDAKAVGWMLPEEVKSALLGGSTVQPESAKRDRGCQYVVQRDSQQFHLVGGADAPITEAVSPQPREWRGLTANRGYATGGAFLLAPDRLQDVPPGSVLLLSHTRPEYTAAFLQAAAVVCDQGGVTSHAAIMAREYGIPCVVDTKNMLETVQDGDSLEVDANQGVVRLL